MYLRKTNTHISYIFFIQKLYDNNDMKTFNILWVAAENIVAALTVTIIQTYKKYIQNCINL